MPGRPWQRGKLAAGKREVWWARRQAWCGSGTPATGRSRWRRRTGPAVCGSSRGSGWTRPTPPDLTSWSGDRDRRSPAPPLGLSGGRPTPLEKQEPSRSRQRPSKRSRTTDPQRLAAYTVMRAVAEGAYANLELPRVLREKRISGRDAAFTTELVYGAIRLQGFYDRVIADAAGAALDRRERARHHAPGRPPAPRHARAGTRGGRRDRRAGAQGERRRGGRLRQRGDAPGRRAVSRGVDGRRAAIHRGPDGAAGRGVQPPDGSWRPCGRRCSGMARRRRTPWTPTSPHCSRLTTTRPGCRSPAPHPGWRTLTSS